MNTDLARIQFAFTSVNHFFFVPVTIGLAFLTALLQTAWHRSGRDDYLRLTRFFGTLLVINIAIGVVTGLVQEFQFGMNWGAYSRLVGNVFGAPLAMEGLGAFFLESTFLGLWLFGWDKLPRRIHLATIWAVSAGSALSAAFILAANSASSAFFLNLIELLAILAVIAAVWLVYEHRDGFAFAATAVTIAACITSIFTDLYPNVMVSSTNPAYNLTVHNTASGAYSLKAMTVAVIIFLPLVLGYQAWTYYVFRKRVSREEFTAPESARQEPASDAAVRLPVSEAEGKRP